MPVQSGNDYFEAHEPSGTVHHVALVKLDDHQYIGRGHVVVMEDAERALFAESLARRRRTDELSSSAAQSQKRVLYVGGIVVVLASVAGAAAAIGDLLVKTHAIG